MFDKHSSSSTVAPLLRLDEFHMRGLFVFIPYVRIQYLPSVRSQRLSQGSIFRPALLMLPALYALTCHVRLKFSSSGPACQIGQGVLHGIHKHFHLSVESNEES